MALFHWSDAAVDAHWHTAPSCRGQGWRAARFACEKGSERVEERFKTEKKRWSKKSEEGAVQRLKECDGWVGSAQVQTYIYFGPPVAM